VTHGKRRSTPEIVVDRGTVAGSGKGMSDAEALALLDDRVDTDLQANAPDIAFVIDTHTAGGAAESAEDDPTETAMQSIVSNLIKDNDPPGYVFRVPTMESPLSTIFSSPLLTGEQPPPWQSGFAVEHPVHVRVFFADSSIDVAVPSEALQDDSISLFRLISRARR
jgi:hypothetical protein